MKRWGLIASPIIHADLEVEFESERNDLNEKEQLIDLLIHDLAGPMSVVSKTITNLLQKSERYGPLTIFKCVFWGAR